LQVNAFELFTGLHGFHYSLAANNQCILFGAVLVLPEIFHDSNLILIKTNKKP